MYANGSIIDLEVPYEKDRNDIIRKHHDQVGHPGINATVDSVQQQYTWKGLYTKINDNVSNIIQ